MTKEFDRIKTTAVANIKNLMDYVGACGRMAAEFGLDADDCPYDKENYLFDIWQSSFMATPRDERNIDKLKMYIGHSMSWRESGETLNEYPVPALRPHQSPPR